MFVLEVGLESPTSNLASDTATQPVPPGKVDLEDA